MTSRSTQELIPQSTLASGGNQVKNTTHVHTQRSFEVKCGKKKAEEAVTDLRERTADTLLPDRGSVALALEGTDLNTTQDNFVPRAKWIQDTNERQLVTRSGLQRLRCCVCDLHHEQAITAPCRVQQFFFEKKNFKNLQHYKVDVIAGGADAAAYKYYKKHEYQDLYNSSVAVMLREMHQVVSMNHPCESRLHRDYSTNNHHSQLRSPDDLDCCFMAILS